MTPKHKTKPANDTIVGVFSLPQYHKWWLEWAESNPDETLVLKCIEIFFAKDIKAESPWSLGEVEPVLNKAPCGAKCSSCFQYKDKCEGRPATKYYTDD